eukprot:2730531-Prymnesium_polylepis.1
MKSELQEFGAMMRAIAIPAEETNAPAGFVKSVLNLSCQFSVLNEQLTTMAVIGDVEALQEYITLGGAVDAITAKDTCRPASSLLHYACSEETALVAPQAARRRELFVAELLERGASVELRNGEGWTPLQLAANSGSAGLVGLLIKAGADPSAADPRGYTPLHQAVWGQHEEVV